MLYGFQYRISVDKMEYLIFPELLDKKSYAPHIYLGADDIQIYLGADDIQDEGTFVWVATGQHVSYTNWKRSQPSGQGQGGDGEEDCLSLNSFGRWGWNDMCWTCTVRPVVCEL